MGRRLSRACASALALLVCVGRPIVGEDPAGGMPPRTLVELPAAATAIDAWLKAGDWDTDRGSPRKWTVGEGQLHMVSNGDSVMIHTKKGFPIDLEAWPIAHFEVKAEVLPEGSDNSVNKRDDAAFRLYFSFDTSGKPPRTVGYGWTWSDKVDAIVPSGHFDQVKLVVVASGPAALGTWLGFDRDLAADYRRCFGDGPVPRVTGVALKCDSNDVKNAHAAAWVRAVEMRTRAK
ncbi:MAG: DUF3047 domain-containing protein [Planctomycetes bacterium]|nr:DUF3047 domain-containing protein [Planctomycetota bacterium]